MSSDAVILGVAGLVVSGIAGPGVASVLSRAALTRQFRREDAAEWKTGLRQVLDSSASALGSAATNVRLAVAGADQAAELQEIFVIGQRLRLWLPSSHPVVTSYEACRESLLEIAKAAVPDPDFAGFEAEREVFLTAARTALAAPLPTSGKVPVGS
ncbi:hypothetical protein KSP35_21040 [Aquihabitans sp. G128]|uniref:hypothetical protein n=1 Tax=Aquihabitans sp. G128 TaxID=2849779 RepID=UPI001C23B925|nr:hypothetical protein [Aquihabitans sp. G128]QXC60779.1 hypothetical protein KSP35_21040 [Aquihabitans sp. G128]